MPTVQATAAPATELYYQDVGEGPPVVLIHGWPLSHRMWESQVDALSAAGYRTIAYDRRGFGESGKPGAGYDYDTFASDLNDLVTVLDLRGVTLAGFSMGGGEVARYVGRYGTARLARVMLLGAVTPFMLETPDNPKGVPRAQFEGMIAALRKDRRAFLDSFFPTFFGKPKEKDHPDLIAFSKWVAWAASPIATQRCVEAFGMTDFRRDLERLDVPTLIVHGDDDQIVPIDVSAKQAHAIVPGSRLEVLKGAPHGFAATHADALNALMLEFLRG
jgi:peroxiredoxin